MSNNNISFEPIMETVNSLVSSIAPGIKDFINNKDECSDVCPPKHTCPSSCILSIHEKAVSGERIIVPFKIKNEHNTVRTYQVGVRPLMDDQGQLAPSQPTLSTNHVQLQPGQSILVTMTLDLQGYPTGHTYETEIVIREDKFNQNICFKLCIEGFCNVPVATPWDEGSVYKKFKGWQSHFMCPPRTTTGDVPPRGGETAQSDTALEVKG